MTLIPQGFNGSVTLLDLPAGGAFVPYKPLKGSCRGIVAQESIVKSTGAVNTPVGFQFKVPNDGTAAGFQTVFQRPAPSVTAAPGEFPQLQYFNIISAHGPLGECIANDVSQAILQFASLTAAATTVEIWEYE